MVLCIISSRRQAATEHSKRSVVLSLLLFVLLPSWRVSGSLCETALNRQVLNDLYSATSGPAWQPAARMNWNTTRDVSTWNGVTCSVSGYVTQLAVPGSRLTGTLPPSIGLLSKLTSLDLHNNQLTGTLPPSWATLISLTDLVLHQNKLSGTLPSAWSTLVALGTLTLFQNQLSGTLPASWSSLTSLTTLGLYQNQLTGTLPDAWSSLTSLVKLYLYENQLTGTLPDAWSTFFNLAEFQMSHNNLTGSLPSAWSSLTSLTSIDVSQNQLTGTLPDSWSSLVSLVSIAAYQNQLNGTLPAAWSALASLTTLDLTQNNLTGSLPEAWASLTGLTSLYLYQNQLTGTLPASWSALTSMTDLEMNQNNLSGTLPSAWSSLTGLTMLGLPQNQLSGTLPASWSSLTSLDTLYLFQNQLTGTLPAAWSSLTALSTLYLYQNQLSGTLPALWGPQVSMAYLDMHQNNLTGSLPSAWSSLTGLVLVSFSENQLTGTLPASWSSLTALSTLYLYQNQLTGSLPTGWSSLTRLTMLGLYQNNLSGTLPGEWSSLTKLKSLFMYTNQLSGTLPASWSTLRSLTKLDLSQNNLTGTLPGEWPSLTHLDTLKLYQNQLSGTLPSSWSTFLSLTNLELGLNQLMSTLPSAWSLLTNLTGLYLYQNQLTGTLPPSWSLLTRLTSLELYQNQLTGTLPGEWSSLADLGTLYLYQNQLSGTLPSSWSTLSSLTALELNQNNLSGMLPGEWSSLTGLVTLYLYQNQLTGSLPPSWSSLTRLTALALYQNQLTGTLPGEWSSLAGLVRLLLFQNKLTGSIPSAWSSLVKLSRIDYSANELVGVIPIEVLMMSPQLAFVNLSFNNFSGAVPSQWLVCSSLTATVELQHNELTNTPLDAAAARLLIGCEQSLHINLCGNPNVLNKTTVRNLKGQGLWVRIQSILLPGKCFSGGGTATLSRALSTTRAMTLSPLVSETEHSATWSISKSFRSASRMASRTLTRSIRSATLTVVRSCPEQVAVVASIALLSGPLVFFPTVQSPLPSLRSALLPTKPIPVELVVGSATAQQDLLVRVSPAAGIRFKRTARNVSTSMGDVSSVVLDVIGDVVIHLSFSGSAGAISLKSSSVLQVAMDIEAGGSCIDDQGSSQRHSVRWSIAAVAPPGSLLTATTTAFRYATAASTAMGHPLTVMSMTGLVSILSLDECMFSDVDPLDSSVSPVPNAAIGPTVGQYYRGAAVVALSLYTSMCIFAVCGAMLLRWHATRSSGNHCLTPHFGTLRFPSVGMLLVGLFGQGLATCGTSLIRLADSAGDIVLGVVSLLVCILLVVLAGRVTTERLQVRIVKQKPTAGRWSWAGRFLSIAVWRSHWQDVSGGLQFKKRYLLLIDDLQRPWWAAVEMSSSVVQGAILGLRINSIAACRGQMWAMTAHCLLVLIAAVYFRPCGAILSNVFLVASKLGAAVISALVLLHALTVNNTFSHGADVATSVATTIATGQVVVQLCTALLLVGSPTQLLSRFIRVFRKSKVAAKARTVGREDTTNFPLEIPLAEEDDKAEEGHWNIRIEAIAQQVAGATSRREAMLQLIRAADPNTHRDERLCWLLQAAIAQRQLPNVL